MIYNVYEMNKGAKRHIVTSHINPALARKMARSLNDYAGSTAIWYEVFEEVPEWLPATPPGSE